MLRRTYVKILDKYSICLVEAMISPSTSAQKTSARKYNIVTKVKLPTSINAIDYGTFYECLSLTNIDIPESVESIGDYAFYSCKALENITFSNINNLLHFLCCHKFL